MNRRRNDFQNVDTSTWPTVDASALPAIKQKTFEVRRQAIDLYATGETLREIEKQTGINSRQLYGLLDRCLTQADDGRIFGFRGLLKHHRIGSYTRTAKLSTGCSATGQGFAGAFAVLLERYPVLAQWLTQKIRKHAVILDQLGTDGVLKTRLRGLGNLHTGFLMQCRAAGITAADYPLNTERMGIRSLSAYVTAKMLGNLRLNPCNNAAAIPGRQEQGTVAAGQEIFTFKF